MKKTVVLFILIASVILLSLCFVSCDMLEGMVGDKYTPWESNGDGTHSRSLRSDPETVETAECKMVEIVYPATCSAEGCTTYQCKFCGYSYIADRTSIDPNNHLLVAFEGKESTCANEGWEPYLACSLCDYSTKKVLPIAGHDFTDWEYLDGEQHVRICRNCNGRGYEAHEVVIDPAIPATCAEKGLTQGSHCSICEGTLVKRSAVAIDPDNHDLIFCEAQVPTCEREGWDEYNKCKRCDYSEKVTIEPLGHDLGRTLSFDANSHFFACSRCDLRSGTQAHDPVTDEAKAPSCFEDGLTEGVHCKTCGYRIKEQEILSQYGSHEFTLFDALAPTCEAVGYNAYLGCARCGFGEKEEIPALGHDPVFCEGRAPTCTEKGFDDYYACSRCEYSTRVVIPALGHDLKHELKVDPTCLVSGHEAYSHCLRCDYTNYREIPAVGHEVERFDEKPATCTADGHKAYERCVRCDYTTFEATSALGHTDGTLLANKTDHYYICSRCGAPHSFENHISEIDPAVEADCLHTGKSEGAHCSECGYVLVKQETTPTNKNHDFIHYEGKAPTCVEEGWEPYDLCRRCYYMNYVQLDPTGHSLTYYPAVAPTCTQEGHSEYVVCANCDYTTYSSIPALGHDVSSYPAVAPTCTEEGTDAYLACSRCAYSTYSPIPALGHTNGTRIANESKHYYICGRCSAPHSFADHTPVVDPRVEPNCSKTGKTEGAHCSTCSYVITPQYLLAKNQDHALTEFDGKAATCTQAGYQAYEVCSRCEYSTYEAIPALGHDEVSHDAVAATCTQSGNEAYVTCTRCEYSTYSPIAALGHSPSSTLFKNEDGHYYACLRCSMQMFFASHTVVVDPRVEPNCGETGLTEGAHCSVCAYVITAQTVIPADQTHALKSHAGKAATCTEAGYKAYATCTRCNYSTYEVIPALGHDEVLHAAVAATCTQSGNEAYVTCSRCDYSTYEAIAALGHAKASALSKNEDGHYYACLRCSAQLSYSTHSIVTDPSVAATCVSTGLTEGRHCSVCAYVVTAQTVTPKNQNHDLKTYSAKAATCTQKGNDAYVACSLCEYSTYAPIAALGHDYVAATVAATCVSYAGTLYACSRCSDSYLTPTGSTYAPHDYDAYTCKVCQRDEMQDYLSKFTSKGSTSSNLISISSLRELGMFLDYICFYRVTSYKFFFYPNATTSNCSSILNAAMDLKTAENWYEEVTYVSSGGNITYFKVRYSNSSSDTFEMKKVCSITPETGEYNPSINTQQDFISIAKVGTARGSSYSVFPYEERTNAISVTTSDQLFFAFEHGYRPVPVSGSAAERALNKAKAICREYVTDEMTDLQKLYAITQWMVAEVAYDHGANEATSDKTFPWQYCTAWYAEGVFDYHIAVCDGIAKAVCILAGVEDIKCVRLVGNAHAWNKVWIDAGTGNKEWYVLDTTHANLGVGGGHEVLSIENFLISDLNKADFGYVSDNYTDASCAATTDANPYSLVHYGTAAASSSNDFVISNSTEMNALMSIAAKAKKSSSTDYLTVEIFIEKTYCSTLDSCLTAIRSGLRRAGYTAGFSYVQSVNTYGQTTGFRILLLL